MTPSFHPTCSLVAVSSLSIPTLMPLDSPLLWPVSSTFSPSPRQTSAEAEANLFPTKLRPSEGTRVGQLSQTAVGRLLAESESGGASAATEPLPLGRWSNPEPRVSNTNPSAPAVPTGSGSYAYPAADAPYVNTAGQTVPSYGASPPPQIQYGNPSYQSQAPQYPAYPPASSQSDPLSNFGQLSLNSPAGGYGSPAPYAGANAPSYAGSQPQTYQNPQYPQHGHAGQQDNYGQAPQPGLYNQASGNYQQQGGHMQSYPSFPPAAGYNQQGHTPGPGGSFY